MKGDGKNQWKSVRIQTYRSPDGEPWMDQEAIVDDVFSMMSNEIRGAIRRG